VIDPVLRIPYTTDSIFMISVYGGVMLLLRFDLTDEEIAEQRDVWGYSYHLNPAAQSHRREGLAFIRRCYYALIATFLLSIGMIVWLTLAF